MEETLRDPRIMHIKSILNIYDTDKYGFDDVIKYCGESIVDKDKVFNINSDNNTYTAIVEGTNNYDVSIRFDKEGYLDASCTCPYYKEDKGYCKHIYALLYKVKCSNNRKSIIKYLKKMKRKVKFKYVIYSSKMNNNRQILVDETNKAYDALVRDYYNLINRVKNHIDKFTSEDKLLIDIVELDDMLDTINGSLRNFNKAFSEYKKNKLNTFINSDDKEDIKMFNEDDELEKEMDVYNLDEEEREEVRKGNFDPWNFEYPSDDELEDDDYYEDDDV